MQKGQIVLGLGALILVLALYFGGKTKEKKESNTTHAVPAGLSFEQYEQSQLEKIEATAKEEYSSLLSAIKNTGKADTAKLHHDNLALASFWHRQNNPALHAYYYYQAMTANKSKQTLESVADTLVYAYKTTEDSVILNNLITFALRSYEEAVKQDTSDVDLRLKLAEAYIQGSQEPMKGVAILKELENKHPNDINILMSLGRLSIQSGQLDKAKERLKKILTLEPQNREAIYFLAITEAQLGHTEEAIRLFELCKLMVNNEDFNKEIDEIVKNLKSKKV